MVNRRQFLSALGMAGMAAPAAAAWARTAYLPIDGSGQPTDAERDFHQRGTATINLWGRITEWGVPVRAQPGLGQEVTTFIGQNEVVPLLERVYAEGTNPNNDLWYRTPLGFIYTDRVQPMEPYRMPSIVNEIDTTIEEEPGFWAQIIVPYTPILTGPAGALYRIQDPNDESLEVSVIGYYGSNHRIVAVEEDAAGFKWYKAYNDKKPNDQPYFYILARHMRHLPPAMFEPIHPGADKRVEVNLTDQMIRCYEGATLVNEILTSSGGDGFATPAGDHAVVYKQPSRYMYSDPENEAFSDPNFFDLPGVPFSIFFTTLGHAIHGTYWHGDYGRPRSHGCLNVTPSDSLWLYRWVEPFAQYSAAAAGSSADPGTPIIVI